jgi:hypothetical protein
MLTSKKEIAPMLLKLFPKIEFKGMLPNSMYKSGMTLIPKLDKDMSKKKEVIDQSP